MKQIYTVISFTLMLFAVVFSAHQAKAAAGTGYQCIFTPAGVPVCAGDYMLKCPLCCPPPCAETDESKVGQMLDTASATMDELVLILDEVNKVKQEVADLWGFKDLNASIYQQPSIDYYIGPIVSMDGLNSLNPYITADLNDKAAVSEQLRSEFFVDGIVSQDQQQELLQKRQSVWINTVMTGHGFATNSLIALDTAMPNITNSLTEYRDQAMSDKSMKALFWAWFQAKKARWALQERQKALVDMMIAIDSWKNVKDMPLAFPEGADTYQYYTAYEGQTGDPATAPPTDARAAQELTVEIIEFMNEAKEQFDSDETRNADQTGLGGSADTVEEEEEPQVTTTTIADEIEDLHIARKNANILLKEIGYYDSALDCHDERMRIVDELVEKMRPHLKYLPPQLSGLSWSSTPRGESAQGNQRYNNQPAGPFPEPEDILVSAFDERYHTVVNPLGIWLRALDGTDYLEGKKVRNERAVMVGCQVVDLFKDPRGDAFLRESSPCIPREVFDSQEQENVTHYCISNESSEELARLDKSIIDGDRQVHEYEFEDFSCATRYNMRNERGGGGGLIRDWLEADKIEKYMYELRTGYNFATGEDDLGFEDLLAEHHAELDKMAEKEWAVYLPDGKVEYVTFDFRSADTWEKTRQLIADNATYLESLVENTLESDRFKELKEKNERMGNFSGDVIARFENDLKRYELFAKAVRNPDYELCPLTTERTSRVLRTDGDEPIQIEKITSMEEEFRFDVEQECKDYTANVFQCVF